MNEDQIIDLGEQPNELYLEEQAREGLKTAANWSMGLAILGFVGVGFMLLAGIVMMGMSSMMGSQMSNALPFPFWMFSLLYVIIGALYFLPLLYLFKFANRMKRALLHKDVSSLTESCVNLGKHYKFMGIMVIALIGLYIVAIFAFMAFGMSAMSRH